jgi:hypothetical protein
MADLRRNQLATLNALVSSAPPNTRSYCWIGCNKHGTQPGPFQVVQDRFCIAWAGMNVQRSYAHYQQLKTIAPEKRS